MRVLRVLLVALAWSLVEAAPVAAETARPYDFRGDGRQALVTGLPLSGMHNAGAVAS